MLEKPVASGVRRANPLHIGERIYATNEEGKTFIFKATPDGLNVEAENQLGNEVFATPTICGSRIYTRVATIGKDKNRQEWLYCIGKAK